MSQITTHILDTSIGAPAAEVKVILEHRVDGQWNSIGNGKTNEDGRVNDLLAADSVLHPGTYRLIFNTADYFESQGKQGFYPKVVIVFETKDESHYHVPLLLNPFGYSTYRGS